MKDSVNTILGRILETPKDIHNMKAALWALVRSIGAISICGPIFVVLYYCDCYCDCVRLANNRGVEVHDCQPAWSRRHMKKKKIFLISSAVVTDFVIFC